MGATFPDGIASFKTHRNLLDDVEAGDINKIQDEVKALEETLGDALTSIQEIETDVQILAGEEQTGVSTDRSILTRFSSLKQMVNYLWEGKNIYAASAGAMNLRLRHTSKDRPYPPGRVNLNRPSNAHDPMGMWNGTGFTLKRDGFWVLSGQVHIGLQNNGARNDDNFGTYEASVTINGHNWTRGLDRRYPQVDGFWHDVMLSPLITGWFPRGTRVTLRCAQSSNVNQHIHGANLAVYRVRGSA